MAGPFVAALLLPPAPGQLALLADPRPDVVVGAVAVLVATVVTWLLAAWSAVVCIAVVGSRLPGAAGAVARRTLVSITPAILRRVILAAAGVSVAAGLAACGSPVAAATAGTATVSTAPMSGSAVDLGVTVDLDWPVSAASPEPPVTTHAASPPPAAASAPLGAMPVAPAPSPATASETTPAASVPSPAAPSPATAPETRRTDDGLPRRAAPSTVDPLEGAKPAPTGSAALPEAEPASATAEPTAMAATSGVIVRPGDSLWSIAAAQLPAGAAAARIDATWRAWYRANRDVVGPDPNLIVPGQVLLAPNTATSEETTR